MAKPAGMRIWLFLMAVVLLADLVVLAVYWRRHHAGRASLPSAASVGTAVAEPAPPAVSIPAAAASPGAVQAGGVPAAAPADQAKAGQTPVNKVDAIIAEVNRLLDAKEYMSAAMTLQKFVMTEQLTDAEKAKLAELLLSFKAQVTGEMQTLKNGEAPPPGKVAVAAPKKESAAVPAQGGQ